MRACALKSDSSGLDFRCVCYLLWDASKKTKIIQKTPLQYFKNVSYYSNDDGNDERMVFYGQFGVQVSKDSVYGTLEQILILILCHKSMSI